MCIVCLCLRVRRVFSHLLVCIFEIAREQKVEPLVGIPFGNDFLIVRVHYLGKEFCKAFLIT